MSKEIYKEYVNGRIDGLEDDSEYLYEGKPLHESEHFIHRRSFMLIPSMYYDSFTRKPKTQMINGHEVWAPRYDVPTNTSEPMFILAPLEIHGFDDVFWCDLDSIKREGVLRNGWFDNSDNVENYANAHRENKND